LSQFIRAKGLVCLTLIWNSLGKEWRVYNCRYWVYVCYDLRYTQTMYFETA